MTSLADTVDTHIAAYCDPDRSRRADRFASVWAPEGQLLDPPLEGRGLDEITDLADVVLSHYPGHRFERTTAVDEHHGWGRYGWVLLDTDGTAVLTGTDIVRVDEQGRLVQVVGFFGELEPVGA